MVPVNDKRNDLDSTGLVLARPSAPFFRRIQNKMVIQDAIDSVKFFWWMRKTGSWKYLEGACSDMYSKEHDSYCYFIGSTRMGFVKIGVSKDPMRRFSAIQTGNPFPLSILCIVPGDEYVEQKLQRAFAPLHMEGEWFRINTALRYFMLFSGDEYMARQNPQAYEAEKRAVQQSVIDIVGVLILIALAGWTALAIGTYTLVLYLMGVFA
jgi:T5orf172 domain